MIPAPKRKTYNHRRGTQKHTTGEERHRQLQDVLEGNKTFTKRQLIKDCPDKWM